MSRRFAQLAAAVHEALPPLVDVKRREIRLTPEWLALALAGAIVAESGILLILAAWS